MNRHGVNFTKRSYGTWVISGLILPTKHPYRMIKASSFHRNDWLVEN